MLLAEQSPITQIILSIISLLGIIFAGLFSWLGHRNSKQVNDAVNHRHRTGTPRIYDLVLRNDERIDLLIDKGDSIKEKITHIEAELNSLKGWKDEYKDGPFSSEQKVEEYVSDTQRRFVKIEGYLVDVADRVDEIQQARTNERKLNDSRSSESADRGEA